MHSLRIVLSGAAALALMAGVYPPALARLGAKKPKATLTFTKLWTYGPTTPGQVSEIPAFDPRTNTIWVVGVVGVDVVDADTGAFVAHIDVTPHGAVNSVAIHNGLAALAVEAPSQSIVCPSCDRRNPGKVLFFDTRTREQSGDDVGVGSLPDMLTFTHDGSRLLVANEATPNRMADAPYIFNDQLGDPPGSVSIIDIATRMVVKTARFDNVPTSGEFLRMKPATAMDFEPEYIAINHDDTKAYVTLQEANAVAVLDLASNEFTEIIGLGAKDFNEPGNEIDPRDDTPPSVSFQSYGARGLYMPDSVATYKWKGETYLVMANEGDFREDNADRVAAGLTAPLDRLRVVTDLRAFGLFATGGRSFSIRRTNGEIVYDSGSILDREANKRLVYDDGRSRDKGVEPEGVALLKIGSRTFAFVGLERATKSAVAVFDITDLENVRFLDMIVTDGNLSPEGLAAYKYRGKYYLAIANEVFAPGQTTANATLYLIESDQADDSEE
jgi:DNA-binding beta-propeller fold protein YncE